MLRFLPNLLTLSRLAASPILAWLVIHLKFRETLGLVALAGLTDAMDGYLARKLGVAGRSGVILDPLADKALLITLYFSLAYVALVPAWLLGLVVLRDIVIVGGSILLRIFRNVQKFVPTMTGKVSTFFQIVFVLMVLIYAAFHHPLIFWAKETSLVLTAIFTLISGSGYVWIGIQLTRRRTLPRIRF